ncbi:MAG: 2'-5' RNA ligase family protein [Deltaproteobacteria bacterium]|nr:2'-5' RNA ligase family protein [Deltaproteobacteria bacterium]
MSTAIELKLDQESSRMVQGLRDHLISCGVRGMELEYPFQPHITIGYFHNIGRSEIDAVARGLAGELGPLPVTLSHVGMFVKGECAVLFFGVTPSEQLLHANRIVHERCLHVTTPDGPYSTPGRLVPHCSLAENIPIEDMSRVLALLQASGAMSLPIEARAEELLVDVDGREIWGHALSGLLLSPDPRELSRSFEVPRTPGMSA